MKMVATQNVVYDGKQLKVGDEFEVEHDIHGKILEHAGSAKEITGAKKTPEPAPKMQTAAIKAEEPALEPAPMTTENSGLSTGRRRYNRRDMVPGE